MLDGPAPVLDVSDLRTVFKTRDGAVHAVNGVSFSIGPGELLGVVGESGSGKSVTMMSVMGLLPSPPAEIAGGSILFEGREVREMSASDMRELRGGEIGFVFQDPMTSLNPVFTVGYQLAEPLRAHLGLSKAAARERAAQLLGLVGIPDPAKRLDDYPHQFSGGMRQRVMIAIALASEPRLLLADEPTTALDVTIQDQILKLLLDLRDRLGMSVILVTHDLGVVAQTCDRVVVMYAGRIMEVAPVVELFHNPRHAYTAGLLDSIPSAGASRQPLRSIEGTPPSPLDLPEGCPFAPRCDLATTACRNARPPLAPVGPDHLSACVHHDRVASGRRGA
jgi:peptide/nickel transport system ATP-binding protein/oligopeptide transport system ATP-binding protein